MTVTKSIAAGAGLALGLLALALACGCGRGNFPQSKKLDDQTTIVLTDAWVLEHMPKLLQTHFVYEGTSPNASYTLRASLSTSRDGRDYGGGWIKQVPIAGGNPTNRTEVLWEFLSFPHDSSDIYLRLHFTQNETRFQKTLDFKLPGASHLRTRKMGSQ